MIGEAGITPEDTERQLEVLAAAGVYDFFDLSIGAPHSGHLTISPMNIPEGYALPFGLRAKRVVGDRAAVFVAGRVVSLAMAAQAVADGAADVVAMTRAHLADPHLVRKRGRETTRCVGANVCVGRALRGVEVACVLNPATGREAYWGEGSLEPAASPKQVVVLGAGPAGLRAAATAAARGHRVVVHEREDEPGGHLRDLAWLPTRSAWLRAVEDLVAAVERNGGELRLGSAPDPESDPGGRRAARDRSLVARAGRSLRPRHRARALPRGCRRTGAAGADRRRDRHVRAARARRGAGGGRRRGGARDSRAVRGLARGGAARAPPCAAAPRPAGREAHIAIRR